MVNALSQGDSDLAKRTQERLRAGLGVAEADRELEKKLRLEWEELLGNAQKVVRDHPLRVDNRVSLGMCLQRLGRYEEALAALREAVRLEPGASELQGMLELTINQQEMLRRQDWRSRWLLGARSVVRRGLDLLQLRSQS